MINAPVVVGEWQPLTSEESDLADELEKLYPTGGDPLTGGAEVDLTADDVT